VIICELMCIVGHGTKNNNIVETCRSVIICELMCIVGHGTKNNNISSSWAVGGI